MKLRYSTQEDGSVVATGTGRSDHAPHVMTWDPRTGEVWRDDSVRPLGKNFSEHAFHVQVETMLDVERADYSPGELPPCSTRQPVPDGDNSWRVACGCGHFRARRGERHQAVAALDTHHLDQASHLEIAS